MRLLLTGCVLTNNFSSVVFTEAVQSVVPQTSTASEHELRLMLSLREMEAWLTQQFAEGNWDALWESDPETRVLVVGKKEENNGEDGEEEEERREEGWKGKGRARRDKE